MCKMIEALAAEKILESIDPKLQQQIQIEIFNSLSSTNDYLLKHPVTAEKYRWCLAEEQFQGRGRGNKIWHSPFGKNIYASLSFLWDDLSKLSGLSLAVGVILAEALQELGVEQVKVKWPNDLILSHKKIAGILIETLGKAEIKVVIGFGINVAMMDPEWHSLAQENFNFSRNKLLAVIINRLLPQLNDYTQATRARLQNKFCNLDYLHGKLVEVISSQGNVSGIARGIDEYGNLLVELEQGAVKSFYSGELSVRPHDDFIN